MQNRRVWLIGSGHVAGRADAECNGVTAGSVRTHLPLRRKRDAAKE